MKPIRCLFGIHKPVVQFFPWRGEFSGLSLAITRCRRCLKEIKKEIVQSPPPHHPNCRCQIDPGKEG